MTERHYIQTKSSVTNFYWLNGMESLQNQAECEGLQSGPVKLSLGGSQTLFEGIDFAG
jgi:hypothetical protein